MQIQVRTAYFDNPNPNPWVEEKCDLCDFNHAMIVDTRQEGLSIY